MKLIKIDAQSRTTKYRQIMQSIEKAIADKRLQLNEKLPSVNKVSIGYSVSRDTVLQAYEELKKKGVIYAVTGKGYYVKSQEMLFDKRIFLLFDELNAFKEDIYNAFKLAMGNKTEIDIYFHHFNVKQFTKLVNDSNGNYSTYVIMPTNLIGVEAVIKCLPKNDVYILDQTNDTLRNYPSICQQFSKDMYNGLKKANRLLKKYTRMMLIFPGEKEPIGMVEGFIQFCEEEGMPYAVVSDFQNHIIEAGTAFVVPNDFHLVNIIEQAKQQQLTIGKSVGIVSYNDIPLKKVVENGITTISTDFKKMGATLANMIKEGQKLQIENPSNLIVRNSL